MPFVGGFVDKFPGGVAIGSWTIDDTQLYAPGHTVHNWASGVARELETAIKAAAPVNKRQNKSTHSSTYGGATAVGYLRANVSVEKPDRVGPRRLTFNAVSAAEYSAAYIFGHPPMSKIGGAGGGSAKGFFVLPVNPGFGIKRKHRRVGGWGGDDFMSRGFNVVAAAHPSLRG